MKRDKRKRWIVFLLVLSLFSGFVNHIFVSSSEESVLADGEYSIPVALWNASADVLSMGNNALMQTGKLVMKQGEGELYLKFQEMTFSGMTGYLSSLDLLNNITYNQYHYPETYTLQEGTVKAVYDVVDEFNGPESVDINCAGKKYPKVISVPVTLKEENIWAHVYVPVMGSLGFGDQLCRIHLDKTGIRLMSEEEQKEWQEYEGVAAEETSVPTTEPAETPDIIATAEPTEMPDTIVTTEPTGTPDLIVTIEPTASTVSPKPSEIEVPDEPQNTPDSTVDKSALYEAICQAQILLEETEKYTESSRQNLQEVLSNAQKTYEADTTQTVVDGQTKLLEEAIASLVEKSDETLEKENLEDGKYSVYVYLWHATADKASMGDPSLNHKALLTVENGVYQLEISTKMMTVGTITACLQSLQIKQADGSYKYAKITARNNPDNQPSVFRFKLPSVEEYIDVLIDPKVEVMGEDPLPARLRIDWESLTQEEDGATIEENPSDEEDALSPAIHKKDKATKITVKAVQNVFPKGTKFSFQEITKGYKYKNALSLLSDTAGIRLYQVQAKQNGKKAKINGMVSVSMPIPSDYKISTTSVYRISNGIKTKMSGSVEDGYYTFSTNQLGIFAVNCTSKKACEIVEDGGQSSTDSNIQTEEPSAENETVITDEIVEEIIETANVTNGSIQKEDMQEMVDDNRQTVVSEASINVEEILIILITGCSIFFSGILAIVVMVFLFKREEAIWAKK